MLVSETTIFELSCIYFGIGREYWAELVAVEVCGWLNKGQGQGNAPLP
ncbi:hypothetical protein P2G85_15145 [Vibrio sp. CAU 1672]|nr:hypothetical protein [Vibrio sp. CAU 1672]